MSKSHDIPATPPAAKTTLLGRLRAPLLAIVARARQRPKTSAAVGGAGMVALIGFATAWTLLQPVQTPPAPEATIVDALDHLRSGELAEARQIATELRGNDSLAYDDRGGPAYVLGVAAAQDAAEKPYPDEQRRLYLVAAKHLETAYRLQFPAATSVEGLILLGTCWHNAARYGQAIPYLREALKRRPRQTSELHRLLASAYYRATTPQLALALEHIHKYVADKALSPAARQAGMLEQARMLLDAGEVKEVESVLAQIPPSAELTPAANVLKARLIMRRADAASAESQTKLNEAIALLRTPPGRDATSQQAQREAQYLLGVCYLKLGDSRAAESQFARAHRVNLGLPEGIAAAIEEADLQRADGKDEAVFEIYRDTLRELGDLRDYSNPWLPLEKLRERTHAAYQHYRDAGKFEFALEFAKLLTPLFSRSRVVQLEAETYQRWGDRLSSDVAALPDEEAEPLRQQARAKYHQAASHYYRLARLNLAEREYPNHLWASAECYQRAHDFHRTVSVLRRFLDEDEPERRPDALLLMGEAELSLGNLAAGTEALRQLLRENPKHPLSYRARLVAHEVYLEQQDFAAARKLLMENLDHESLTPRSLEWRDSLFALGQMLYRQGLELEAASRQAGVDSENPEEFKTGLAELEKSAGVLHEAIQRLSEAIERYPEAPQAFEARYLLAEAYRQAAKWPRKRMPTITIETTRAALARQMQEELIAAHALYTKMIEELNARQDVKPLAPREREILRNCYFLSADALFDLGRFDEAIEAYSNASNRYQNRPEALEAFVQIASCYRQLDQPAKARGTLEQAKVMLQRIPAGIEFNKTTRYSRDEWVSLLDFLTTL